MLVTNHGRECQIEVRKTERIHIQGKTIIDAAIKKPMFGRYQKRGDNAWRYEGEFLIGREPRNAKLLKAALLALSREGIQPYILRSDHKTRPFFITAGTGKARAGALKKKTVEICLCV